MKLMTKAIEKAIPALYSQDGKAPEDVQVHVKFFHCLSNYTFFATEYDPEQRLFFGLAVAQEVELGYLSLDELEATRVKGLPMERDMYMGPMTLAEARAEAQGVAV